MANKKQQLEYEKPDNKTNGITKINTTRTQKIIAKTKTATKRTTVKSTTPKAKTSTKKATSSKQKNDSTINKKTTTKTTSKKTTTKINKTTRNKKLTENDKITTKTPLVQNFSEMEYYDLPFTYNQTVVKILAQTPEILFVYWDISEEDRKKYVENYGENFFNETKPVLIITNKSMGYTFEVEINDFANSWYLHVKDAKCEYSVELGRRPIAQNIEIPNNYVYVASSNVIEAPNDHILFEKEQNMVYFKNVKTNIVSSKPITNLSFVSNMGKIYNIYDVYKNIYKDETFEDSSKLMGNSSSIFK